MILRTVAALDSMPGGTVVLDSDGDAWQKDTGDAGWWTGGETGSKSAERILRHGPFRTMRAVDE